jgi:hypothetical protein
MPQAIATATPVAAIHALSFDFMMSPLSTGTRHLQPSIRKFQQSVGV